MAPAAAQRSAAQPLNSEWSRFSLTLEPKTSRKQQRFTAMRLRGTAGEQQPHGLVMSVVGAQHQRSDMASSRD